MSNLPTFDQIQEHAEEIALCLWRHQESSDDPKDCQWLEEMDNEVLSLVSGLSSLEKNQVMDHVVKVLEDEDMPPELINYVFEHSGTSRVDLDAYRLSIATPGSPPTPKSRF